MTGKCVATEGEAHHRASQLLAQVTATFGRLVEGDYSMDLLAGLSADEAERVKVPKLFNGKCMSFKDKVSAALRSATMRSACPRLCRCRQPPQRCGG